MHIPSTSMAAALIAGAAFFAPSVQAASHAAAPRDAPAPVQLALAEGDPVPAAMRAATPAERMSARDKRRQEGATAARGYATGEGNPVPASMSASEDHGPTRAERRTQLSRAIRSGELGFSGEVGR
ncbi:MAG: hypothetical protein ACXWC6_01305 [Ramlibacter sp.]